MKNLLILSFILIIVSSCNNSKQKRIKAVDFIPENASTIFKINNLEAFNSNLNNNTILSKLNSDNKNSNHKPYLSILKHYCIHFDWT
jgi:hypothetical protein